MSDAATVLSSLETAQLALLTIASGLGITSYLFPQNSNVTSGDSFDFIIIGAGSAGSVIANRLTENENCTVLVVEAGGDPPIESFYGGLFPLLAYSKYDWNYTSTNDGYTGQAHNNGIQGLTSGKMIGGSSALHHLIYARGYPYDYNKWAEAAGDSSWNYTNVYDYILKLEQLRDPAILNSTYKDNHGLSGKIGTNIETHQADQKYLEALAEIGRNVVLDTVGTELGYSEYLFMIADGVRQSTAYTYLRELQEARSNLYFLKETLATKVLFDSNKAATGVTILTSDGEEMTVNANKEVILSAGAFGSAKLLMLSGVGPSDQLESFSIPVVSDVPVGQDLQDHVSVFLTYKTGELVNVSSVSDYTQFPLPGVVGYSALNSSQEYPDYQILSLVFQSQTAWNQLCAQVFAYNNSICDEMYSAADGNEIYLMLPVLLHPSSRGNMTLKSTDPSDNPVINMGYFSDDSDLDALVSYIEDSLAIMNSTYFQNSNASVILPTLSNCADYVSGSTSYWKCYCLNMASSIFHYSGTCAMGSVVDSDLLVKGVTNLRVADGSVMPYVTCGNTEVPIIVIAEKVSDLIKTKYAAALSQKSTSRSSSGNIVSAVVEKAKKDVSTVVSTVLHAIGL